MRRKVKKGVWCINREMDNQITPRSFQMLSPFWIKRYILLIVFQKVVSCVFIYYYCGVSSPELIKILFPLHADGSFCQFKYHLSSPGLKRPCDT